MEMRCLNIPAAWAGKTVEELNIENRFGVQIIGLYHAQSGGDVQTQQEVDPKTVLAQGDILAISGTPETLAALAEELSDLSNSLM